MNCKKCGNCCRNSVDGELKQVIISPNDCRKISNYLNILPSDFLASYCKEKLVGLNDDNIEQIKIYYIEFTEGACAFLSQDNLCTIYRCRPLQCINAPYNFLSDKKNWKDMPCVDLELLEQVDSSISDNEFIMEFLQEYPK